MSYLLSKKHARKDDCDFIVAAARAFYVDWWCNRMGELGKLPGGCELTDVAPETQPWAFKQARDLARYICLDKRRSLRYDIFLSYVITDWIKESEAYEYRDREPTEDILGWYAAMSSMGHGVGLEDLGISSYGIRRMESG